MLVLGDSFFSTSTPISAELEGLARAQGALGEAERYRDNSRSLDNSLAFGGNGIAEQFRAAVRESPVQVVIMNGGGGDVLGGNCEVINSDCPLILDAAEAARDLFVEMASQGVQQVVYAFYPNPLDANLRAKVDALRPAIQAVCQSSPVPCHWLDLRPVFAGKDAEFVQEDGRNPTAAGSRASALAIWDVMRQQCIAQ